MILGPLFLLLLNNIYCHGRYLERIKTIDLNTKPLFFSSPSETNFYQLFNSHKHVNQNMPIISSLRDKEVYILADKLKSQRKDDNEEPFHDIGDINHGLEQILYDGDITLTAAQAKALHQTPRQKRQAIDLSSMLWPKTEPIPFFFDSSIDSNTSKLIQSAIDFWQNNTCLNFVENSSALTRIKFYKGNGCSSFVGRVDGEQSISIGARCNYFGIISHEIAHSLGIFHYQSRPDRDDYIDILWNNVPKSWASNLQKEPHSITLGMPYEYGSIMHYAEKVVDSGPVQLLARDPRYQRTMGNRDHPTFNDVLLINKLYSCETTCPFPIQCFNFGYPNPKNCQICNCPEGFGGPDCSQPAPPEFGANCGGILQANNEWQKLDGEVGEKSKIIKERQAACHWHITSPIGTRISIEVTNIQGPCSLGCFYGSTEIKLGNFTMTGIRLCCASDLKQNSNFITDGNMAVISIHSQLSIEKFSLTYKIS